MSWAVVYLAGDQWSLNGNHRVTKWITIMVIPMIGTICKHVAHVQNMTALSLLAVSRATPQMRLHISPPYMVTITVRFVALASNR